MRYKVFGRRTGLRVSEVALGTGNFGTRLGYGTDPKEARALFDAFAQAGGNFIDTSDNYQFGQSEELVGDFIKSDRDRFVVASKFTQSASANPELSSTGNSRKNMIRSVEASLKRLQTDRIDLYWAHMADGMTPVEEILKAFEDLVRSGKILHAGLSNFPAWRVARGALLADMNSWSPLIGLQVEYSLIERSAERELLPMAESIGLGTALWSPLGGGLLTGKYRNSPEGRAKALGVLVHRENSERATAVIDTLLSIANESGESPTRIAIAWLLKKAERSTTALVPILGPRRREHLSEALAALELDLAVEQTNRLDHASTIALGVPHEMLASERYRARLNGGRADGIDPPVIPPT